MVGVIFDRLVRTTGPRSWVSLLIDDMCVSDFHIFFLDFSSSFTFLFSAHLNHITMTNRLLRLEHKKREIIVFHIKTPISPSVPWS